MLERKKYSASCKVLKNRKYETWLKDLKKMVDIRGGVFIFSRGEGPKIDKGYLRRMNMKEIMRIYLLEVSDIGSKSMMQVLYFA